MTLSCLLWVLVIRVSSEWGFGCAPVLPAPQTQEEAQNIGLLLLPKLLEVFVSCEWVDVSWWLAAVGGTEKWSSSV